MMQNSIVAPNRGGGKTSAAKGQYRNKRQSDQVKIRRAEKSSDKDTYKRKKQVENIDNKGEDYSQFLLFSPKPTFADVWPSHVEVSTRKPFSIFYEIKKCFKKILRMI